MSYLRENYRSILAAEQMKEAIERMDSGLLFAVGGRDGAGRRQFDDNRPRFEENLRSNRATSRCRGNRSKRDELDRQMQRVSRLGAAIFCTFPGEEAGAYRPLLRRARADIRQDSTSGRSGPGPESRQHDGDGSAPAINARNSVRLMIAALIFAVVLSASAALFMSRRFLLRSTQSPMGPARWRAVLLTSSCRPSRAMSWATSRAAFNEMARTLREYRQAGTARLLRRRRQPRRRSTRSPIRSSWSTRSARLRRPTRLPGDSWASCRRPILRFPGIRHRRSDR